MKKTVHLFLLIAFTLSLSACYRMRMSNGGGQIGTIPPRAVNPNDVALPPGYRIEAVAGGLTFPADVAFDNKGNMYVIETGYSYGEVWQEPKLMKVNSDGTTTTVATGARNGPWTSVVFHDGNFYISEGGEAEGGKILRVSPQGDIKALVTDLPSLGDHHTDMLVIKDGYIYFGQGTATNSGVVGNDNWDYGWLKRYPDFHDVPCKDITLAGQNYTTDNILTDDPDDKAVTGAYLPYGTPAKAGQVVKGKVPCSGAVMRIPLEGGQPQLVAWGLRNPYGLAVAPDGNIYISENGYDDRGSRPVWGTADVLWKLEQDAWYGWPEHTAGRKIIGLEVPGKGPVKSVLQSYPATPPKPVAELGVHSSSNGMDFSTNDAFGHKGELFIAEFGDMAPDVGKVLSPVGFKVVRVNTETGVIVDFAVNKGKKNAPASKNGGGGLERPLSAKFNPAGDALYVVDFGILKMGEQGPMPQTKTGVIWKITKTGR